MTKNQFSRRDFFKLGAVGAAGAAAAPQSRPISHRFFIPVEFFML